jgi:hypothetical protein
MKRIYFLLVFMAALQLTYGQKSIDNLFQKYSGKDGFTSVTLSGNLLKLVSDQDDDLPSGIMEMRILTQEDKSIDAGNFYDIVMNDINRKEYEEFMSVKDSDHDLKILVRAQGDRIQEFLLVGGGDDNVLIQVKGDMNLSDVNKFSEKIHTDHNFHRERN